MSTSTNLPAGATLLSISGKRCTAIPRTDSAFLNSILATALVPSSLSLPPATTTAPAVTTAPPAAVAASSAAPQVAATSAPSAPAVVPEPPIVASAPATTSSTTPLVQTSNTPTTIIVASASPTPPPDTSTIIPSSAPAPVSSPIPQPSSVPIPSSTPLPSVVPSSSVAADPQPPVSNTPIIVAPTSSTGTTAATTTSSTSSTSAVAAQSELSPGPTSANDGINSGAKATPTSSSVTLATSSVGAQSITAAATTSSGSKVSMPMVGGILGAVAFVGIVGFILWFLRRRRRQRDSFLTPLGSDPGDHSRSSSVNTSRQPITPLEKIRSQIESKFDVVESKFAMVAGSLSSSVAGLKSRIKGVRSKGVNMDRGNSQFMERIPQHSRQNSALSGQQAQASTKERFLEWFDRMKEDYLFRLRVKRPQKEFVVTREKQGHGTSPSTSSTAPDFSQLLAMEERELHIESERRRQVLANGSPGLNKFDNPFSDAPLRVLNPDLAPSNPFADSAAVISTPLVSQHPASGYVSDVRRSRGQSISAPSRYASTYGPDRDTYGYRDTYMTSATTGRKTKGRSDPFDLDSLQFEASSQSMPTNNNSLYMNDYNQAKPDEMNPRIASQASAGTYSSKYSSQALSGNWGGPGPDLGSTPNLNSESYLQDTLRRNQSNGSGKSVGKAM